MRRLNRRTTPRVRGGRVRAKNRTAITPNYWDTPQEHPVIDRQRPGEGYRHLLRKVDVERFVELLPDWPELSRGLDAIVLAPGEVDCLGWYQDGVVAVCAWDRQLRGVYYDWFVEDHRDVLDRLGVPTERAGGGTFEVGFTENSARGFQLMHVLLHELGHHHDRMSTRSRREAARGEPYAEAYALRYADRIWEAYFAAFDW